MCDTSKNLKTGPAPSLILSNGSPKRMLLKGMPPAHRRTHLPTSLWSLWKGVPHLSSWTGISH
ncbi:unnamed protein product, partial [Gulo gulo]